MLKNPLISFIQHNLFFIICNLTKFQISSFITFQDISHNYQSGHYFITGATGRINMSLRNTIHFMETRGFLGQVSLIENDFI